MFVLGIVSGVILGGGIVIVAVVIMFDIMGGDKK